MQVDSDTKMKKVYNAGKRAYTVEKDGKPFVLEAKKSVALPEEYADKLVKSYPRDLKDQVNMGFDSAAKDAEIARLKAENEKLKKIEVIPITLSDTVKAALKKAKITQKAALEVFEADDLVTDEQQLEYIKTVTKE